MSAEDFIGPIKGPELFFGLVGPVGANLQLLCDVLQEELQRVEYESEVIRLSELLHEIVEYSNLPREPEEARYHAYMNAGNELRQKTGRADALALLSVSGVRKIREMENGKATAPLKKYAYIFRSLKHPDEVSSLRKIYGKAFFLISAYSARERRVQVLAESFARSHGTIRSDPYRSKAEEIIVRDEAEVDNKFGQNVREAFPEADLFVSTDDNTELEKSVRRFVQILFSYPFHTPDRDEFGMFHAKAAALRSADLSRQVGAVIVSQDGDIIGLGCNEVPKAGGGLYWTGDQPDRRDYNVGYDSSSRMKEEILRELIFRLKKAEWLSPDRCGKSVDQLLTEALYSDGASVFKGTQITNILEFGRIVHAEMAALTDAARLGISVKGATMYCTTFPCHMCARHIVAAGLGRVVYVEPYPKSMAAKLYPDSIAVDVKAPCEKVVTFEPFSGVAPRSYVELFEAVRRKDGQGNAIAWSEASAKARVELFEVSYVLIEGRAIQGLSKVLSESGLELVGGEGAADGQAGLAAEAGRECRAGNADVGGALDVK